MKKLILVLALILITGCKDDKKVSPEPTGEASVLERNDEALDLVSDSKKDESVTKEDLDFITNSLRLISADKLEEFANTLSPELKEGYGDLDGIRTSLRPFYEAGDLYGVEKIEKPSESSLNIITNHEKENLKISLTRGEDGKLRSYQMTPYTFAMRQEDLYKKYPDLVDKTVDTINFVYAKDFESFKKAFENSDLSEEEIKKTYDKLIEETEKRDTPAETSYQFVDPALKDVLETDRDDLVQLYFVVAYENSDELKLLVTFTEKGELISLIHDPDID